MTNSFWFSNNADGDEPIQLPAVEPSYEVEKSVRFDGEDNDLTRTPTENDGKKVGETGQITDSVDNGDGTVTLTVEDGFDPHQVLSGEYLQVGDSVTQDSAANFSTTNVASTDSPYIIQNSLRFNPSDNTYLSKETQSSNRKTWTFSCWFKKSDLDRSQNIFAAYDGSGTYNNDTYFQLYLDYTNQISIYAGSSVLWRSSAIFLDTNAWYHITAVYNSKASNTPGRLKVYLNGEILTRSEGDSIAADQELAINNNIPQYISDYGSVGANEFYNGYLAEVNFVDGFDIEPSAFAGYNELGSWVPKSPEDISSNISNNPIYAPLPTTPNKSEDWPAKWSGTSYNTTYSTNHVHDSSIPAVGDTVNSSNSALPANGEKLVMTPDTPIPVRDGVVLRGSDGGSTGDRNLFIINEGLETQKVFTGTQAMGGGFRDLVAYADEIGGFIHSITLRGQGGGGGNSGYLGAIFVDGRYLETGGPADDSQVWSSQAEGQPYTGGVKEHAFDGDLTTEAAPADGTTMSFIPNEQLDGQVTIIARGGDANSQPNLLTVNGVDYTVTLNQQGSSGTVYEFNVGESSINTTQGITWSRAATGGINFCHIHGIKVGGKLLVDGVAQLNTSQVWSDATETNSGGSGTSGNLTGTFDGELLSGGPIVGSGTTYTATLVNPLPIGSYKPGLAINSATDTFTLNLQDASSVTWTISDAPVNLPAGQPELFAAKTVGSPVTSITITVDGASGGVGLKSITVDDAILTDSPQYGQNGFYLPFDAEATGKNYSQGTYSANPAAKGENLFDGNTSTYFGSNTPNTSTVEVTFDPPLNGDLEVFPSQNDSSRVYTVTHSGGTTNRNGPSGAANWLNFGQLTGITKIVAGAGTSNYGGFMSAIRLDGEILFDYSSIGTDASGNGNHWQSQNFTVGNTSQVWSNSFSSSGGFSQSKLHGFDGDLTTQVDSVSTTDVFTLDSTFEDVTSLRVLFRTSGNIPQYTISMSGNGFNTVEAEGTSGAGESDQWQTATLTSTTVSNIQISGQNTAGPTLVALEVNGKILVDANIQDTVKDTPNASYATLNPMSKVAATNISLANGNLEAFNTTPSPQGHVKATQAVSSGKWYYEAQILTEGGNQEVGFIGVDQGLAYGDGFYPKGYSYVQTGNKGRNNGFGSYGDTYTVGDVIGIALDLDNGTITFYKNGVSQGIAYSGLSGTFTPAVGAHTSTYTLHWSVNFGQHPFTYTPPADHKSLNTNNI